MKKNQIAIKKGNVDIEIFWNRYSLLGSVFNKDLSVMDLDTKMILNDKLYDCYKVKEKRNV